MDIETDLLLPYMTFKHWNASGREVSVLVVKGTFMIRAGERLKTMKPQPELLLSDLYHGDPQTSSMRQESDLAPFKPKTDVTFHAVARSPNVVERRSWPVRFAVKGHASHGFHIFGDRFWEPCRMPFGHGWSLSDPLPITHLPVTYEYAYGGGVPDGDGQRAHEFNLAGRGLLTEQLRKAGEPVAAPQIGLVAEYAEMNPTTAMTVCGCAPVTKSWKQRLSLAGTFDDEWLHERHPLMPKDHNQAYWNAAPAPLQISPYLEGNELIETGGLRHDPAPYTFALPGMGISCRLRRSGLRDSSEHALNLDTVHCDIADENIDAHWVSLTWRLVIEQPDTIDAIEIYPRRLDHGGLNG